MKITETIFDILTQETTIIERDALPVEIAEREAAELQAAQDKADAEAKAAQRAALLAKLGITEEEAKLLLS